MDEPVTKRRQMIDMEEFERHLRGDLASVEARLADARPQETTADLGVGAPITGREEPVAQKRLTGGDFGEAGLLGETPQIAVATSSPKAPEPEGRDPDALQSSLPDDNMACQDSGNVHEKIASRRSLNIMIMAAIIIVGMVGIWASFSHRSGASPPPEIATMSDNGPAKSQLEKTNRSDVPTPDASILATAPQPSLGTVVDNVEQPVDPLQPRETMPAAGIAASPEQIETRVEPSSQTAPIEPEKMNTASVERHDALLSSDMPPRATAKIVPLPVPRPAAMAKASTPKTAARATKPKRPASTVAAQPMQATNPKPERVSLTRWEIYCAVYAVYLATLENRVGNVREP